jgi:hypothetical protein
LGGSLAPDVSHPFDTHQYVDCGEDGHGELGEYRRRVGDIHTGKDESHLSKPVRGTEEAYHSDYGGDLDQFAAASRVVCQSAKNNQCDAKYGRDQRGEARSTRTEVSRKPERKKSGSEYDCQVGQI